MISLRSWTSFCALQKSLSERGILLEISKEGVHRDHGFDPALGARPLRRSIQQLVEDEVAEASCSASTADFSTIKVHFDAGRSFHVRKPAALPGRSDEKCRAPELKTRRSDPVQYK